MYSCCERRVPEACSRAWACLWPLLPCSMQSCLPREGRWSTCSFMRMVSSTALAWHSLQLVAAQQCTATGMPGLCSWRELHHPLLRAAGACAPLPRSAASCLNFCRHPFHNSGPGHSRLWGWLCGIPSFLPHRADQVQAPGSGPESWWQHICTGKCPEQQTAAPLKLCTTQTVGRQPLWVARGPLPAARLVVQRQLGQTLPCHRCAVGSFESVQQGGTYSAFPTHSSSPIHHMMRWMSMLVSSNTCLA